MPHSSNAESPQRVVFRPWKWLRRVALAVMLAAALPQAVHAQPEPATSNAGEGAPGGAPPIQTASRPLTMEIVIVVLMVGAALFVVCKSSRRN